MKENNVTQENFVLKVENLDSPVIITVPHGGIKNQAGSWLDFLFEKRVKNVDPLKNIIKGEKIVLGGDTNIMHIVADIMKIYPVNLVVGLLPREFVDYNRFVPKVAYADKSIRKYYNAYHDSIKKLIEKLQSKKDNYGVTLLDFHGFGKQPQDGINYDIILGTNNGISSPNREDETLYHFLKDDYKVFCQGKDGIKMESELYKGDSTNLFYSQSYGIDGVLVEIAPRFRSPKFMNSKKIGEKIAEDLAEAIMEIDGRYFDPYSK